MAVDPCLRNRNTGTPCASRDASAHSDVVLNAQDLPELQKKYSHVFKPRSSTRPLTEKEWSDFVGELSSKFYSINVIADNSPFNRRTLQRHIKNYRKIAASGLTGTVTLKLPGMGSGRLESIDANGAAVAQLAKRLQDNAKTGMSIGVDELREAASEALQEQDAKNNDAKPVLEVSEYMMKKVLAAAEGRCAKSSRHLNQSRITAITDIRNVAVYGCVLEVLRIKKKRDLWNTDCE